MEASHNYALHWSILLSQTQFCEIVPVSCQFAEMQSSLPFFLVSGYLPPGADLASDNIAWSFPLLCPGCLQNWWAVREVCSIEVRYWQFSVTRGGRPAWHGATGFSSSYTCIPTHSILYSKQMKRFVWWEQGEITTYACLLPNKWPLKQNIGITQHGEELSSIFFFSLYTGGLLGANGLSLIVKNWNNY